jgi:hypothetical protein
MNNSSGKEICFDFYVNINWFENFFIYSIGIVIEK